MDYYFIQWVTVHYYPYLFWYSNFPSLVSEALEYSLLWWNHWNIFFQKKKLILYFLVRQDIPSSSYPFLASTKESSCPTASRSHGSLWWGRHSETIKVVAVDLSASELGSTHARWVLCTLYQILPNKHLTFPLKLSP